jgi:iron complex outermembrane receptor protein
MVATVAGAQVATDQTAPQPAAKTPAPKLQAPATPNAQPPAPTNTLEEVTVTAQRRRQNLEDVPIAVTQFSSKDILQQQINGTADVPRLIPNMFTNNNTGTGSGNVYFLRGLGQTESFPTFDPQVATYVDDIYIGRESASNFGLFDVSQIQVLRGPQGTLFGRNATGGAIVISLAKPAPDFGGYFDVGYGMYNRVFGQGSVNVPLSPQVLTEFSFYGIRDDGYVKDVATGDRLNAHDDWGVREAVRIQPSALENVTWDLSGDYGDSGYNAEQNAPVNGERVSYSGFGVLSSPIPVIGAGAIEKDYDTILREDYTKLANGENITTGGFMSNVQVDLGNSHVNLISGIRAQEQLGAADFPFPGASGPLVPYDNNPLGQFGIVLRSIDRQYSQEIKWTGTAGRLTYTVGGFYLYEENSSNFVETLTVPIAKNTLFGLELGKPEHFHNTTNSQALYAQGDYKITDALTFTAGARITHEAKRYTAAGAYDTTDVLEEGNRTSLATDQLTPRFALDYRFDPEFMAFVSATRGFQGGGWNSLTAGAQTVTAFGPETLWTYEAGIRYETQDKKLRLNADFFYNDVHNYQLITLGPGTANFVTENAAGMIAYGFEADIAYKPIEALTLAGNIGIEEGYYVSPSQATRTQQAACRAGVTADCAQGIVEADGTLAPPEDFPPITGAINAIYDFKYHGFDIQPSAAVQLAAASHVDTSGVVAGISPFHYLLDVGVRFQPEHSPWSLTAECQNCTMQNYETSLLFVKYYNTPGIWDIRLHRSF